MEHPQLKPSYPILSRIVQILNEAPWYEDIQGSTVTAHKILSLAVKRGEETAAFRGCFMHREELQHQWDRELNRQHPLVLWGIEKSVAYASSSAPKVIATTSLCLYRAVPK
jgi:hypothetical protein